MACLWPLHLTPEQRKRVIECAKWSKVAYSDVVADGPEMKNVSMISCDDYDAQGILFNAVDGSLVLAIRGTTSAEDMMCDVQVVQSLLDGVKDLYVHDGFNDQFKALSKVVNERVSKHLLGGGELVCTGHSLGAGVAALFAVSYGIKFKGKVSYFGYGSPRQGNDVLRQLMASQTSFAISVKNNRDPVCGSVPAICLPSKYAHAGGKMHIGTDPCPEIPLLLYVRDHDISRYIAHLCQLK